MNDSIYVLGPNDTRYIGCVTKVKDNNAHVSIYVPFKNLIDNASIKCHNN